MCGDAVGLIVPLTRKSWRRPSGGMVLSGDMTGVSMCGYMLCSRMVSRDTVPTVFYIPQFYLRPFPGQISTRSQVSRLGQESISHHHDTKILSNARLRLPPPRQDRPARQRLGLIRTGRQSGEIEPFDARSSESRRKRDPRRRSHFAGLATQQASSDQRLSAAV